MKPNRSRTAHIFLKSKYSKFFEETSVDAVCRRAAIAQFSKQRTILVCCALVSTAAALVTFLTPGGPFRVFSAAMM